MIVWSILHLHAMCALLYASLFVIYTAMAIDLPNGIYASDDGDRGAAFVHQRWRRRSSPTYER